MNKLEGIPLEELKKDLDDSVEEQTHCLVALKLGLTEAAGINNFYRLRKNADFVGMIVTELKRRGLEHLK